MFERFGEYDSAEEINSKAEALLEAKDEEALIALAVENGLDKADAEDYLDGYMPVLTTALQAAIGKLMVERKDLKLSGVLLDWVDELMDMCAHDVNFCMAVRRKGKELAGYIALTAESGYEHRCVVDKRIVNQAGKIKSIVGSNEFSIGIPDKKTRKELALKYYM